MAVLPIRIYPDPVLRVRCAEQEEFDAELQRLIANMVETMHRAPGVGLAAPQIGVERRVAVVDVTAGEEDGHVHVLVNPVIVEEEGSDSDVEGCLSIPDLTEKVTRPEQVTVEAQNAEGSRFRLRARGLLARAICHEIDHLDGILFVDRVRGLRKERAKRHLRRLKRQHENEDLQWNSASGTS